MREMLRHPTDGSQWRNVDREFLDFEKDARNIRFDQFDDLPPFSVDVEPSILLSKEDTPYLRRDHNHGTFIKRKIIFVPLNIDQQFSRTIMLYLAFMSLSDVMQCVVFLSINDTIRAIWTQYL